MKTQNAHDLSSMLHAPCAEPKAVCIGCGCTDGKACIDPLFGLPCFWIIVDYKARIGVCSECEHKLEEFEERAKKHQEESTA